jgi:hypothetical protein
MLIDRAHLDRRTRRGFDDSLSFFGTEFDDEGLHMLAGMRPDLRALYLMQTRVGAEGMAAIAYFHKLETLHLDMTPVTNRAVMRLSMLSHLRDVSFDDTELSDAGLTALISLPLERISAKRTEITDRSASVWSCWPDLQAAYLNGTYVADETAQALANLPDITEINLSGTSLTNAGLVPLARAGLKFLFISSTRVDDEGVAALANHPTLEALTLDYCAITDRSVETMLTIPNLEYIDIAGTQITDMGLLASTPRFDG